MSSAFRLRPNAPSSTTLLGVFLAATVVLSCWLALEAYLSTRSHRATTEAVLRDYAGIGAAEFSRVARDDLARFYDVAFDEVPRRTRERRLPELVEVAWELDDAMRAIGCRCEGFRQPRFLFRAELPPGTAAAPPRAEVPRGATGSAAGEALPAGPAVAYEEIRTEPAGVPDGMVHATLAAVRAHLSTQPTERYGLFQLDERAPGGAGTVAYAVVRYDDDDGRSDGREQADDRSDESVLALYGIVFEPAALAELASHWQQEDALLPASITRGLPNDSTLFVAVESPTGNVFRASSPAPGGFAAVDTLEPRFGSLVVQASVPEEAAGLLVIGGLPRSRLPFSLALLGLTLAVGAAGLLEVRRHHHLARLREDFISSVSHELRTPLTQIRMLAELQADGKLRSDAERSRANKVMARESQRLTQLVENILQFSRLRAAPAAAPAPHAVSVERTVEEVLMSFRPLATSGGATIETDLDPGLTALAHREGLRRILMNLLDNALKYGPPEQTLRIDAHAAGDTVRISIGDEGPGIPEEERERIWEAYRRLPRDVDSNRPGSGVGLAVVRSLVRQLDGKAWVEDAAPHGARFVVELPRASLADAEPATAGAEAMSGARLLRA